MSILQTQEASELYVTIPDSPTVEIIVRLKLPIGHYEVAAGLAQIHEYKYFDDFVSDLIKEDIDRELMGSEPLYDSIHRRLTGRPSEVKEKERYI
jgi:hypothetical protein